MNRRNFIAFIICSIILIVGIMMTINNSVITTNSNSFFVEK